jgi:DNA replication protein DnaC
MPPNGVPARRELHKNVRSGSKKAFKMLVPLTQLAKVQLLVIDDFGLTPMTDPIVRDLLKILEDRYDRQSTLITSQLPIEQWHAYLGDKTVADAIPDRLAYNAHRITLKGESMRKQKDLETAKTNKKTEATS